MKLLKLIYKFLFSRFFMMSQILLLQVILLFGLVWSFFNSSIYLEYGVILLYLLNAILVISIINRKFNPAFKLAWIAFMILVPGFGGIVYLMFANHKAPKSLSVGMLKSLNESQGVLNQKEEYRDIISYDIANQFEYVSQKAYYPYYHNSDFNFYGTGEEAFGKMKEDLKKAKHFIFLEFFIVKPGEMYNQLKEILKEKVKEGVEVYFIYDDGGSLTTSNFNFQKDLESIGVKVAVFNPVSIRFMLLSKTNNRDHRKIVVVDNEVGYVGGINIADEYINLISRFGYWKDGAGRISGEAVKNLTVMFIQFFNACNKTNLDYNKYTSIGDIKLNNHNHIQPFSDSPADEEDVGHTVHLNLINQSRRYVYIETPYLIPDYSIVTALVAAAKRGVDVRIVVPAIPDKKSVYMVTQSNCRDLLKQGVKIYEYTPGFIHSKNIIVDDELALIGTINMDYRSYYLHYECGILVNGCGEEIKKMRDDFLNTCGQSKQLESDELKQRSLIKAVIGDILNVFSPLL